jgi:hypothetical protein
MLSGRKSGEQTVVLRLIGFLKVSSQLLDR